MEDMISTLSSSVLQLQQSLLFRDCAGLLATDCRELQSIDAGLDDIENRLAQISGHLEEQKKQLKRAAAITQAAAVQTHRTKSAQAHLPTRLPGGRCLSEIGNGGASNPVSTACAASGSTISQSTLPHRGAQQATAGTANAKMTTAEVMAMRLPYVRKEEFESVSNSTRGRLSCEQVNSFVDTIHTALTAKNKILTAPRASLGEPQMKKLVQFREQETDETRGLMFFVEEDLKTLAGAKVDSVAKACLLVLRSLKRLRDCRSGGIHRYIVCA